MDPVYDRLPKVVNLRKCWDCKLFFNIADDPDTMSNEIDLCQVMNSKQNYMFPESFDGLQNKAKLLTELKVAALRSGFTLCQRSAKSPKHLNHGLVAYITLVCQHGRVYNMFSKQPIGHTYTKRSKTSLEKCSFSFNISMIKEDTIHAFPGRWQLCGNRFKRQVRNEEHCGHFQLHPSNLHSALSMMGTKEIELAKQCSQLSLTSSATAGLLNIALPFFVMFRN